MIMENRFHCITIRREPERERSVSIIITMIAVSGWERMTAHFCSSVRNQIGHPPTADDIAENDAEHVSNLNATILQDGTD